MDLPASVHGGHQALAPISDPFDGLAKLHAGNADQQVLGITVPLIAEPTAHVGSEHPDRRLGKTQRGGQFRAEQASHLRLGMNGEPSIDLVPVSHDPPGFERNARMPTDGQLATDYLIGVIEHLWLVSAHTQGVVSRKNMMDSDIVAPLLVDNRRVLVQGGLRIGHRVEGFVVDIDTVQGIFGQIPGVGHYRRHRFAHIADLADR